MAGSAVWTVVLFFTAGHLIASDAELRSALATALSGTAGESAPVTISSNTPAVSAETGGTGAGSLTNATARLDDKYRLAIGDRVNFQVIEDQDNPKVMLVADSGDIEVPYLGPIPAQGKTCRQLATEIKNELEKKYYYQATVVISVDAMLTRGLVYLVGAVRSPGPLEMPRNDVLTISKAILRAGGLTDFADAKDVRVTRQGQNGTNTVFTMDVSRVLTKGKLEEDKPAQSGDLIFVPEKTIRF
jgi:polysaccharide export outer membrane protein